MKTQLKYIAAFLLLTLSSCQEPSSRHDQDQTFNQQEPSLVESSSVSLVGNQSSINAAAKQAARSLLRDVQSTSRDLSEQEIDRTLDSILLAREIVAGRSPLSNVLCLPSTSKPGKYCLKSTDGNPTCIGNYFDNGEICRQSLASSRDGRACFQSASKPGKALISEITQVSSLIGNYFPDFGTCNRSMEQAYGPLVCMASAKLAGKWFIANLDNAATQVGGYVDTLDQCLETFALE